ncbi:polyprotein [Striga-associated poty-like virus 1]|nr:polyprotein [Striga-associated poty-like virus 1]
MDYLALTRIVANRQTIDMPRVLELAIKEVYGTYNRELNSAIDFKGEQLETTPATTDPLDVFIKNELKEINDAAGDCGKIACVRPRTLPEGFYATMSYAMGGLKGVIPGPVSKRRCFRDGYCYMNIFVAIAPHVYDEDALVYAKFLNDCPLVLGSWPTMNSLAKAMIWIGQKIPNLYNKAVPAVSISHTAEACHVVDQRGPVKGWHILDAPTFRDVILFSLKSDLSEYIIGGDPVTAAYMHLSKCIRHANNTRQPWVTFNKMVLEDSALAATLVLSPATLIKLESWFEDREEFRRLVATIESGVGDALTRIIVIKRAIEGVKIHFLDNDIETATAALHQRVLEYIRNADDGGALNAAATRFSNLVTEKKEQFYYFEKRIHSLSDFRWRREHDFGVISIGESCCTGAIHMLRNTLPYLEKLEAKEKFFQFAAAWRCLFVFVYLLAETIALALVGWFSIKRAMLFVLKVLARHYLGQNHMHHLWLMAVMGITTLIAARTYIKALHPTKLQASANEKRMTGLMAFVILVVHVFDVDLALMLSSSLRSINQLAVMLTEETNGLLPKLIGTRLQFDESDLADLELEMDPEEVRNETLQEKCMTFGMWLETKVASYVDYTRELQYGGPEVHYRISPLKQQEIAEDMTQTKRAWNSVTGGTGSGKSTRIPVFYYQRLKQMADRNKRILVCEPSRATVVNVAAGISSFLGEQVYYKHRTKEQAGNMGIQVMTYGSALMRAVGDSNFLNSFDAVFLDESHIVSEHGLTLEALLDGYRHVRKFYVSATPRAGPFEDNGHKRFQTQRVDVENSDPNYWLKEQGRGTAYDVTKRGPVVLCFVQGRGQADKLAAKVNNSSIRDEKGEKFTGYSLHSENFDDNYPKVIKASNEGETCFIFCTNILETGVTLSADCVVDFGSTMRPELDIMTKRLSLNAHRVTQFERHQRIGRVGRVKDGFALCCGKAVHGRPRTPPEVVYGAALYSFVYDLDLFADESLDTSWLANITKKQAEVMLSFDLPIFVLRDLVGKDGAMRGEMITALKKNLLRDMHIVSRDISVASDRWQSWPRAHDQILNMTHGDVPEELEKYKNSRIPFVSFTLNKVSIVEFVEAAATYEPKLSFKTTKLGPPTRRVLMRIDPDNINQCHQIAVCLREHLKGMLNALVEARVRVQESKLLCMFPASKRLLSDQEKRIAVMKRNIQEVDKHIGKLTMYDTFVRDCNVPESFDMAEFQKVHQHMELQARGNNNETELKKVLDMKHSDELKVRDVLVHHSGKIALGMVAMSGAYLLSSLLHALRSKEPDAVYTLEGKGKPYNRSKRSEAVALNQAFDMFEELKQRKEKRVHHKERPSVVSNLLKKTNPFVNFYDIADDSAVTEAVFKMLDGSVVHKTTTPIADIPNLGRIIAEREMDDSQPVLSWADEAERVDPDQLICEVTLKDGRRVHVDMTKHKSRMMTRTGGLAGYENKDGQFRQVGSTRLEVASSVPFSKINIALGRMVGTIADGSRVRLNAILYGDFIICPAHTQVLSLPITFRFEHATCTVDHVEAMKFEKCDLILIKRPNSIAPVKVVSKATTITEPTLIQIIYRDLGSFSCHVSASDLAVPFDNGRFSYSVSTKDGMCGAAIVDVKTGMITGIHVSANDLIKRNFMEPFSTSMVDVLQKKAPFVRDEVWYFDSIASGYAPHELDRLQSYEWALEFDPLRYSVEKMNESAGAWGMFNNYHRVSEAQRPVTFSLSGGGFEILGEATSNLCNKHKIVGESVYWKEFKQCCPDLVEGIEEYEDAYCPSALNREAYYKDVGKYDRHLRCRADINLLIKARNMVKDDLKKAGLFATRLMTAAEVLGDLDVNTAAGALYACKKKLLFTGMTDDQVVQLANCCYDKLVKGESVGIWNGSLKDELRPVEKVLENKTRVFTAAPLTTLIGGKFVVDDFNKQFYGTHLNARHTVGINPWAGGWHRLAQFLGGQDMPYYVSGDGSRFDSSLDPILFDQVLKLRLELMPDVNGSHAALKNLYHEIVFTPILLENGQIVMKKVGNNSGQPSTVVDNTIILMMCFYYACLRKTNDEDWIRSNFLFVCNGDDQKCAMTQDFLDKGCFDFDRMLSECGLTYEFDELTSDIKEYPYMSLTMVESETGHIGFMLDQRRIVAINQWMTKKGVLGVAQRAFPAMLHAYNDPWLFTIMHAYLVWLLVNYEDEILYQMRQTGERVSYLSPAYVKMLHYGGTHLQVDSGSDDDKSEKQEKEKTVPNNNDELAGVSRWIVPKMTTTARSLGFRSIRGTTFKPETFKNIPRDITAIMRNDCATDAQYIQWESEVRADYDIATEGEWNTVFTAWLLYCANNGTTDKYNPLDVIPMPDGRGGTVDRQIGGFIRASSKVGLRKLMRKFSRETSQMLLELGQMTKWGLKRGFQDRGMIPYAFDFYVFDEMTPPWVREQLSSAKHSALGRGVRDTLLLDDKHHDASAQIRSRNDQRESFKAPEY